MGIRRTSGGDYDLSNPLESFADVVRWVVLQPVGFFAGLPRRGSLLDPLVFALICTEIAAILGGILSLAGTGGAFVRGYGFQVSENQGFGEFKGSVVLAPIGGVIVGAPSWSRGLPLLHQRRSQRAAATDGEQATV